MWSSCARPNTSPCAIPLGSRVVWKNWGTMFQTEPWRLRAPSFAKAVVLSQCACMPNRSAAHVSCFWFSAVATTQVSENKGRLAAQTSDRNLVWDLSLPERRRLYLQAESNTSRVHNKREQPNQLLPRNRKTAQLFGLISRPQCGLDSGPARALRTVLRGLGLSPSSGPPGEYISPCICVKADRAGCQISRCEAYVCEP